MVRAKRWIIVKHFQGEPKKSDLQLIEEELPPLQNEEFLVQAKFLSVDPYMRLCNNMYPIGITMIGAQVAEIVESKNLDYPVGELVVACTGWSSHAIVNLNKLNELLPLQEKPYIVPDFGDLPVSLALAYFGFLDICKPKKEETLVVSGAAGAVRSHVGQLGKNLGLTVIGIAGSDEKCDWLKNELGFDHAINYKTQNIASELKRAAPNGVDCYFDNVGGDISSTVINQMNLNGRISVCSSVSSYNANEEIPRCAILQPAFIFRNLKMEGYLAARWSDHKDEAVEKNRQMICDEQLKNRETVTVGFDKMFDAFVRMLRGENTGKAIVKA